MKNKKSTHKIVAVGVGTSGINIINQMINEKIGNIHFQIIAMSPIKSLDYMTYLQVHDASMAPSIEIGEKFMDCVGIRVDLERNCNLALSKHDEIKNILKDSNIVFVLTGLGGGTGSSVAPVVAMIAKEIGAFTISIVTKPFKFEGKTKEKRGEFGLELLKKESDFVVAFEDTELLSIIDPSIGLKKTYKKLDSIITQKVVNLLDIVSSSNSENIFENLNIAINDKKSKTGSIF